MIHDFDFREIYSDSLVTLPYLLLVNHCRAVASFCEVPAAKYPPVSRFTSYTGDNGSIR